MEPWIVTVILFFLSNLFGAAVVWGGMWQKLSHMREQRTEDLARGVIQRTNDKSQRKADKDEDALRWTAQKITDDKQEITLDALEKRGLKLMFRDQCGDLRVGCRNEMVKDISRIEVAMEKGFQEIKEQLREYRNMKD